ncbi:glycine betaine transporter, partial [Listeria fleischmannii subsp. coloradonensis]
MKKIGVVFWCSVALILLAVLTGVFFPQGFETATANIQEFLTTTFGWYYLLVVVCIVAFCVFLILSPIG